MKYNPWGRRGAPVTPEQVVAVYQVTRSLLAVRLKLRVGYRRAERMLREHGVEVRGAPCARVRRRDARRKQVAELYPTLKRAERIAKVLGVSRTTACSDMRALGLPLFCGSHLPRPDWRARLDPRRFNELPDENDTSWCPIPTRRLTGWAS